MAEAIADVLRARRIEVVDDDGVVRAVLRYDADSDDAVLLELFAPKRGASLVLCADADYMAVDAGVGGNSVASLYVRVEDGETLAYTGDRMPLAVEWGAA